MNSLRAANFHTFRYVQLHRNTFEIQSNHECIWVELSFVIWPRIRKCKIEWCTCALFASVPQTYNLRIRLGNSIRCILNDMESHSNLKTYYLYERKKNATTQKTNDKINIYKHQQQENQSGENQSQKNEPHFFQLTQRISFVPKLRRQKPNLHRKHPDFHFQITNRIRTIITPLYRTVQKNMAIVPRST